MASVIASSTMKSVCILLQNYYEIDIRVRRKAEALVAEGYTVDVLSLHSSHSAARESVVEGVNVYTFSLSKERGSKLRYVFEYFSFLLWTLFKLARLMKQRRYSVVDVNNLPDFLVFAAAFAKWKGAKVVFDMHEITPEFIMSKYDVGEGNWQVRLAKMIERASMRYADHVITINEPIQRLLETRGLAPAKSTVIMNAVDESMFASAAGAPVPAKAAASTAKFVMMYHGTLTRIYGMDIAIEAFGLVQNEMPDAELWILGSGPDKSLLEDLARQNGLESRVRFLGTVLPNEIRAWLNRCDIGVLATRRDVFLDFSFSNKLSEYIIMGKAVICSRLKAIGHYFSADSLAYFEPNAPRSLSQQMLRLYRDKELRARLAAKAKEEYAPIAWEVMERRYLDMMARIAGVERVQPLASETRVSEATHG
jgi:glycosyltransferase involved in cell wall biosynthesis